MPYNLTIERRYPIPMPPSLSLIPSQVKLQEKRIFPRFPFPTMTFKTDNLPMAFQVSNISTTGMRILLKNGANPLSEGHSLEGTIHWQNHELRLTARVVWAKGQQAGLAFEQPQKLRSLLSRKNIIQALKPLHLIPLDSPPPHLKCWLKAASVFELLIWGHGDGKYQKIQALFDGNFVEWQDGQGLQTGKLLSHQDKDTPLFAQDELTLEMDQGIDQEKLTPVRELVQALPLDKIQESAKEFTLLKLQAA